MAEFVSRASPRRMAECARKVWGEDHGRCAFAGDLVPRPFSVVHHLAVRQPCIIWPFVIRAPSCPSLGPSLSWYMATPSRALIFQHV
eukprot:1761867-Pleurochrysis_carterae.AAC.1